MSVRRLSYHTYRQYLGIQAAFVAWCDKHGVRLPASYEQLASYLRDCIETRGPRAARQHLSGIANYYRASGDYLDTRAPQIQRVMRSAQRLTLRRRS